MRKKYTIECCREIAKNRNGKCLSEQYIGIFIKMRWECEIKHQWFATLNNIKNYNQWCPHCAGVAKLNGLEIAQQIAKERGGRCISKYYINNSTNMEWECSINHRWFAALHNIKDGNNWCPKCASKIKAIKNTLPNGIEIAQEIAIKHGGKCLSTGYVGAHTSMHWECSKLHNWWARFGDIVYGKQWCRRCSKGKTQNLLYDIIQDIFPMHIICINYRSFDWLALQTNKQEIDIFVPDLKLAIEYDGQQHFKPVRFGGISEKEAKQKLKKQKRLDKLKNKKIARHPEDIYCFIRFNYKEPITKEYVISKLIEHNINL